MIFQGQEFLEDCWFHDQDPIDWSRVDRFRGILQLYRDLIGLRRNVNGSTGGLCGQHVHVYHANDADKVLAYHRWDRGGPEDDVIVVVNLANRSYPSYTIGFPRPGLWQVRLNSDWRGYDQSFGDHPSYHTAASGGARDGLPHSGDVGIGPYTVIVLSQDPE
jgi:1,4-alpha-glucan branching enzyme